MVMLQILQRDLDLGKVTRMGMGASLILVSRVWVGFRV